MLHVKHDRAQNPAWQTVLAYVWPLAIGALLASCFYVRPLSIAQPVKRLSLSAQALAADATTGDSLAALLRTGASLAAWRLDNSDDGGAPYNVNPWLAEAEPECTYHGPEHGLFEPSTPHPRFIVTGGAGFVGSHLVTQLAAEYGPRQVKVIDNFKTGFIARFQRGDGSWIINPQQDICALDLRVLQHVKQYVRGADYVYHLAQVRPQAGTARISAVVKANLLISSNTLRACRVNGISNFIHVSSACSSSQQAQEYMQSNLDTFLEGHFLSGTAADNITHVMPSESQLDGESGADFDTRTDLNVGFVKLHHVYGPSNAWPSHDNHKPTQLVASILHRAIHQKGGARVVISAPGDFLGDFVYVEDAVQALMLVKDKGMSKGVIEIGSGPAVTSQELVNTICDVAAAVTGRAVHVRYNTSVPLSPRGASGSEPQCDAAADSDVKLTQSMLGWEPRYSLQQGLSSTLKGMLRQPERSRVLVVLFGQPRGGELAWRSIHKHLMLPNNAHLATVITPINTTDTNASRTMLEAMAHWVWHVPEPADGDWGVWMDKAAGLCPQTGNVTWVDLCQGPPGDSRLSNGRKGIWGGGFKQCPKHYSMSAVVLVYAWVASQRIMAWNLHQQYYYIIYSRPDQLHLCDHLVMGNTLATGVGVPEYKVVAGTYDRHMVGASPAMLSALNHTQDFACNPEQYQNLTASGSIFNHETLMARVWGRISLPVWRYPMTMFAVRSQGDPTSWSKGVDHPALSPFGLMNKHWGEYNQSLANCKVTNVTRSLELIQQHQVPLFS